jgi:hypothetical protein
MLITVRIGGFARSNPAKIGMISNFFASYVNGAKGADLLDAASREA